MPRLRNPPKPETAIKGGVYLTDGKHLYWVRDACGGEVLLENCAKPSKPAQPMAMGEVLRKMRLVRPEA